MSAPFEASPVYYAGWKSYRIPFVPDEPITADEASKKQTYYVGYYDDAHQLVKFQRYVAGRLDWTDEYTYTNDRRIQRRLLLKSDGSRIVQEFDRAGRVVRTGDTPHR
jgi:Family of unknown function (DUF6156)